jgi:hypothetical protein
MLPTCSALYLQNTPSLTGSYSHPAAPSLGSEACLEINFPQNGSLFAYCHSRFLSGTESSLHDFFSCLSIFIFSILFFLERAIAYCLLIASFVARSLSWTLSDDQLSCKISAFFCAMKCSRVKTFHCAKWHKLSVYMLGFRCKSLLVGWGIPHILSHPPQTSFRYLLFPSPCHLVHTVWFFLHSRVTRV